MASADQIIPAVSSYIERHAFTWWGKPELRAAKLGPDAALIGAWPLLQECG
jgi:hypothetical protein